MEALLEFIVKNLDFLHLDPRYRITDSTTGATTITGSLVLTSPTLSWNLSNDRGQMGFNLAPTASLKPEYWFRLSIVRQYLDGFDETIPVSAEEAATWMRDNIIRVEGLFAGESTAQASCADIIALEAANARKYWGNP
jgi:hypothetical protein